MSDSDRSQSPQTDNKRKRYDDNDNTQNVDNKRMRTDASNKIIIRGLPFSGDFDENTLRDMFGEYGAVADLHIPMNREDNSRNRGFCFVTFENQEGTQKALDALQGYEFEGRQLYAEAAKGPELNSTEIFVRPIPTDADEDQLKEFFGSAGTVVDVRIPQGDNGNRGFAFLGFSSADEAARAVETLNGADLRGTTVSVMPSKKSRDNRRGGDRGGFRGGRGGFGGGRGGYGGHGGDRRGGYEDRRGGYEDRRGGYGGDRRGGYGGGRGGGYGGDRRGGYEDRRGGYERRGYEDRRGGYEDRR